LQRTALLGQSLLSPVQLSVRFIGTQDDSLLLSLLGYKLFQTIIL
jgi:hypothetical protein